MLRPDKPGLTATQEERESFLSNLADRSRSFLEREIALKVSGVSFQPDRIERLELKNITSIITIEDCFKMIVAFSFERPLLDAILKNYSDGIRIDPSEYTAFLEETAGDMINIVVGNALEDFQKPGYAFSISTPIILSEAKSILRYKNSDLFIGDISTELGRMTILCITPGQYYTKNLDIEAAE